MEIYTRDFLQNYKRDSSTYSLAKNIVQQVLREAGQGKTRYVQKIDERNGIEFSRRHTRDVDSNIIKVTRFLKRMLPDTTIEYKQSERLDGSIESGIVIDWS